MERIDMKKTSFSIGMDREGKEIGLLGFPDGRNFVVLTENLLISAKDEDHVCEDCGARLNDYGYLIGGSEKCCVVDVCEPCKSCRLTEIDINTIENHPEEWDLFIQMTWQVISPVGTPDPKLN